MIWWKSLFICFLQLKMSHCQQGARTPCSQPRKFCGVCHSPIKIYWCARVYGTLPDCHLITPKKFKMTLIASKMSTAIIRCPMVIFWIPLLQALDQLARLSSWREVVAGNKYCKRGFRAWYGVPTLFRTVSNSALVSYPAFLPCEEYQKCYAGHAIIPKIGL